MLELALNEWRKLLEKDYVVTSPKVLDCVNKNTFTSSYSNQIIAIIKPGTVDEVKKALVIANTYKIPIYPISCGHNTGYGSSTSVSRAVLCDLSRLNRIVDFNNQYGYVQIEPGVTFQQLFEYLAHQHSDYIMTATGASPKSSIIGNILERGVGKGPQCNRADYFCALEFVSAEGELINTSEVAGRCSRTAKLQRHPLGPSLESLFSQSNFGVVTSMTLFLRPIPKHLTLYELKLSTQEQLPVLINKLRELIEHECISVGFSLFNDTRGLVNQFQLPLETNEGLNEVTKRKLIAKVKQSNNQLIDTWNCTIVVNSLNQEMAEIKKSHILNALDSIIDSVAIDMVEEDYCRSLIATAIQDGQKKLSKVDNRFLSYLGMNSDKDLNTCYWRSKKPTQERTTPEKDNCGIIWVATSLPFCGDEILRVITLLETVISNYNFELPITLQCVSSRVLYLVLPLLYDLENETESTQAMRCYNELLQQLLTHNYLPYRLANISMDSIYRKKDKLSDYLKKIKMAVDPNKVLSPGRYEYVHGALSHDGD